MVVPGSANGAGTADVTLHIGGEIFTLPDSFTYLDDASTPSVESIAPSVASSAGATIVTITGSNFSPNVADNAVELGGSKCVVYEASPARLVCALNGGDVAQDAPVVVRVDGVGLATVGSQVAFAFAFEVSGVTPASGGRGGGQTLTISGRGLAPSAEARDASLSAVTVTVGGAPCVVLTAEAERVTCTAPDEEAAKSPAMVYLGTAPDQKLPVVVFMRGAHSSCAGLDLSTVPPTAGDDCGFAYKQSETLSMLNATSSYSPAEGGLHTLEVTFNESVPSDIIVTVSEDTAALRCSGVAATCPTPTRVELEAMVPCQIDRASGPQVTCSMTAEALWGGIHEVYAYSPSGRAGIAQGVATIDVPPRVRSATLPTLSLGGARIEVYGAGFVRGATSVTIGTAECADVDVRSPAALTCTAPGVSAEASHELEVQSGGQVANGTVSIEYRTNATAYTRGWAAGAGSVTISGRGFPVDGANITARFGDTQLTLLAANETHLLVDVSAVPAGSHELTLQTATGFAVCELGCFALLEVNASVGDVSPSAGSRGGGTVMSIAGAGFGSETRRIQVDMCGVPCAATAVAPDSIECVTGAMQPLEVAPSAEQLRAQARRIVGGAPFSSYGVWREDERSSAADAFDGNLTSAFFGAWSGWDRAAGTDGQGTPFPYVGLDLGQDAAAYLSHVSIFAAVPELWWAKPDRQLERTLLEGSADGSTWVTLLDLSTSERIFSDGWNTFDVDVVPDMPSRFIQVRSFDDARTSLVLAEIELYGVQGSTRPADKPCDVRVRVTAEPGAQQGVGIPALKEGASALLEDAYTYSSSLSAAVTAVAPSVGSTLGGDTLTLSGTFDAAATYAVSIDGIECAVLSASATAITCVTGPRPDFVVPLIVVSASDGRGDAVIDPAAEFLYIDRWSDERSWGISRAVPLDGDSVVIPPGQSILLDIHTPQLFLVVVEGRLIFSDESDVSLDASYVLLRGGEMRVGTLERPFEHNAVITLHGEPLVTPELPLYGAKNIAVRRGVLDMHGAPKSPAWTRLAETARAGSDTLLLLDATSGWRAGDVIVVASTDFEMDHAEEVTIAAVAHGGRTLILSSPLTHTHLSVSYTHGGKTIEMRAEVGILSRSVKVRGDEGSAETQWGAHIMLHSHGDNSVVGHFSNVELANVGQAFNLGASSRGCACARTAAPRPGP